MSTGWVARDDEGEIDAGNLATQKWLDGHHAGAQAVVAYLRKESARLFIQGNDDAKATFLRDVCGDIVRDVYGELCRAAAEHARNHPWRIAAAMHRPHPRR